MVGVAKKAPTKQATAKKGSVPKPSAKATSKPAKPSAPSSAPENVPKAGDEAALKSKVASIQARASVSEAAMQKASLTATGEYYDGDTDAEGRRHGMGTLTWANGNQYKGEWKQGRMTGKAIFTYGGQGGDVYEGNFLDDKKHGPGQYVFANGNTYIGVFESDKRHGQGEYRWVCGDRYTGEWFEGKMHGKGVTIYANGNTYTGFFKEDRRDGPGKLVCVDGLSFDGDWKNNMRNGYGVLTFPNGDKYEGGWVDDMKHGKGIDTFVNGNRFEGHYSQNQKLGKGIMSFANGDTYDGHWSEDTMHGHGIYKFNNGYVYEGDWYHDLRHGKGSYKYNNTIYTGEWFEDKRHGKGTMSVDNDAEIYEGQWCKGKMDGTFQVAINKPIKAKYVGEWSMGVAVGTGTFTFPSGTTFEGTWDESKRSGRKSHNEVLNIVSEMEGPAEESATFTKKVVDDAEQNKQNEQTLYIECLQRDNVSLMQQINSLQEDKDSSLQSQQQVSDLQRLLKTSNLNLEMAEEKIKQQDQTLTTLQQELAKRTADGNKMAELLSTSQKQTQDYKKDAESREAQLNELQKQVEALAKAQKNAGLELELVSQQESKRAAERVEEAEKNLAKAQKTIEQLEAQMKAKEEEFKKLQQALKDVQADSEKSKATIKEKDELIAQQAAKIATLEEKVEKLTQKVAEVKKARAEGIPLEEDMEDLFAERNAIKERDHKITTLQQEINALKADADNNVKKTKEAEDALKTLKAEAKAYFDAKELEIQDLHNNIAELSQKYEAALAQQGQVPVREVPVAPITPSVDGDVSWLETQILDLKRQLQEMEEEKRSALADMAPQMSLLNDLREAKIEAEQDLKIANREMRDLKEQLKNEKKLRKRAEKLMGDDTSVESYRNQNMNLKLEIERKNSEIDILQSRLEGGGYNMGYSHKRQDVSDDPNIANLQRKIKELIATVEEKDRLLAAQAEEVRRVTQLQSQLQVAQDKIEALNASTHVNGVKEVTRMMQAQNQMETRYLMSLDSDQREAEINRELMRRVNSDISGFKPLSSGGSGSFGGSFGSSSSFSGPVPPRARGGMPSKPPSRGGSRKDLLDL